MCHFGVIAPIAPTLASLYFCFYQFSKISQISQISITVLPEVARSRQKSDFWLSVATKFWGGLLAKKVKKGRYVGLFASI